MCYYLPNQLINQCRACDFSCNTCSGSLSTNCLSCTGLLYLNKNKNTCVTDCGIEGLTVSTSILNECGIPSKLNLYDDIEFINNILTISYNFFILIL